MRLTQLSIQQKYSYRSAGESNPIVARVKIEDGRDSVIECELSEETMQKLLDVVAVEIVTDAENHMRDFAAAVRATDGAKSGALIGADQ